MTAPATERDVAELLMEIERLKGGLQWYADGNHYELEGWEDCSGESSNWLFPTKGEDSWMVDDGGIAKAVLDGWWINPNQGNADWIIIGKITDENYDEAMARIETLMIGDPDKTTLEGKELELLAEFVEQYEREKYPSLNAASQDNKADHSGEATNMVALPDSVRVKWNVPAEAMADHLPDATKMVSLPNTSWPDGVVCFGIDLADGPDKSVTTKLIDLAALEREILEAAKWDNASDRIRAVFERHRGNTTKEKT